MQCNAMQDEASTHRKRQTYDQGQIPTTAAVSIAMP